MRDHSMTKALAEASSAAADSIESKRRAMQSPEVSAFIKEGAGLAEPVERPPLPVAPAPEPTLIQLNAKIPEDLHRRARRAVFENQLGRLEPSSIQELVAQALRAELKRLGY